MASRMGQGDPWYTFRVPGIGQPGGPANIEREMTKFGEKARALDRLHAEKAQARTQGLTHLEIEAPAPTAPAPVISLRPPEGERGARRIHYVTAKRAALPKFSDLGA